MNKRTTLISLTVISMVILTFSISQVLVQRVAASPRWQTSSDLSLLAQGNAASSHTWHVVRSPSRSGTYNSLNGVAAISASDVWAVGFYNNSNDVGRTLTEHWNGIRWSIARSPNTGFYTNDLEAVSAISSTDVWAVGYDDTESGQAQRLIEHWNGNNWSIVPNPGQMGGLFGVTAVAANDVWAVGSAALGDGIEHWNGTQWSVTPSP